MFRNAFLLLSLFLLSFFTSAQVAIVVEGSGGMQVFDNVPDAVTNASAGDYIYLPEGSFAIGDLTIDKELHFRGVGHNPTHGRTTLNGTLRLVTGADNSSFTGFYMVGVFQYGNDDTDEAVDNVTIKRCNLDDFRGYSGGGTNPNSQGLLIQECITRSDFFGGRIASTVINNSFIYDAGNMITFDNAVYTNCIIFKVRNSGTSTLHYDRAISNTAFINCIFYGNSGNSYSAYYINYGNSYTNCLFTLNLNSNANLVNELEGVPGGDVFVNPASNFDYNNDYSLPAHSPGKNYGTDGTDVGVYGGSQPFKASGIPIEPHVIQQNVNGATSPDGKLRIRVEVAAQEQ